jgi:hypothetical protein
VRTIAYPGVGAQISNRELVGGTRNKVSIEAVSRFARLRFAPSRFVLADTEQLHRKISEMSERIRQLEDALAIFQAGISSERHPLLRDELLSVKFGPEVRRTVDDEYTRNALSQSIDALGTLTIGENGETKYIGRSGGSEVRGYPG